MPVERFEFDSKSHYIHSSLTNSSNVSYVIQSTHSKHSDRLPQVTSVQGPASSKGVIHWKDEKLEIDGDAFSVSDVKSRDRGMGVYSNLWLYKGTTWRVNYVYDAKTWNVFRFVDGTVEEKPSLIFKLYRSKLIGDSSPASVEFESSLSNLDAVFLLTVVLYSEYLLHLPQPASVTLVDGISRGITGLLGGW